MLMAVSLASAAGSNTVSGHSGHTASLLFDGDDVAAITEWDRDNIEFGAERGHITAGHHAIATDEDDTTYVVVSAQDDADPEFLTLLSGIVACDDAGNVSSVYRTAYDGGADFDIFNAVGVATFSVGSGDARIDDGDVVVMGRAIRGLPNNTSGTIILAFDPDDVEDSIRVVYETADFQANDMLLDPTTESIVLPVSGAFMRLTYDTNTSEFEADEVQIDSAINFGGELWGIDGSGNLYIDARETIVGTTKRDWFIYQIDPDTGDTLDDRFANPTGSPAKGYSDHQIAGFAFDSNGKFWLADWKKSKNPGHFLSKANGKGKFPYKKRIAGWTDHSVRSVTIAPDGRFYLYVTTSTSPDEVWVVD